MNGTVSVTDKDAVILVNDVLPEYIVALEKLEKKLKRTLRPIVLLDKNVQESGRYLAPEGHPFETRVCDYSSLASMQEATRDIFDKTLVVACQFERNQPFLQKLSAFFPYNFVTSESSLDWATSKSKMRELMNAYDSNIGPKFIVLESRDSDLTKLTKDMHYPMIVKPNGLADSMLVTKCLNENMLLETVDKTFSVIDEIYKRDKGRGTPMLLIEEFMEGDMFSIDAYIDAKGNIYQLPLIHVQTAHAAGFEGFYSYRNDVIDEESLSKLDVASAQKTVASALRALRLRNSAAHVELFLTPDGWKIIELGPRIGGYRQDMYFYGYGIDHAYNEFLIKTGLEPEIPTTFKSYCNIFNLYADSEGIITAIRGYEEALQLESVVWMDKRANVGDEAIFSTNGGKLRVEGVLKNESLQKLDADNKKLRELIQIDVE